MAGNTGTSGTIGFTIDTVTPTVTSVTSTASGRHTTGDLIPVTVNFSEAVTVSGTPTLTLALTSANVAVNYTSGSGTTALTFDYTVAAGQNGTWLDYALTSALSLGARLRVREHQRCGGKHGEFDTPHTRLGLRW